ncbi:MAG: cell surface protein SprA [Gemmatimonadetes bacterium]|nr:cell surface protein SprA [Gemmatimonadota bacterium]
MSNQVYPRLEVTTTGLRRHGVLLSLALGLALAAVTPLAGQTPGAGAPPPDSIRLLATPGLQGAVLERLWPVDLGPLRPEELFWAYRGSHAWGRLWLRRVDEHLAVRRPRLGVTTPATAAAFAEAAPPDTVAYLPPGKEERRTAEPGRAGAELEQVLPGFMSEYADLGMRIRGRAEFGGAWTRFRPCDPVIQFSCNPSLFPQLRPDIQFGIQVGGTISQRVHVSVDYDQTREFSAANNINIYYQGLEDEILQRLEVGDVSFSLPQSRFLTQGIPAGNFGFKAAGQVGPIDFQTVWAQQKGDLSAREFRLSGAGGAQGFVQEDTLVVDDADYVRGQFFFLVDPRRIRSYPHIDILALVATDAPPGAAPGRDPIQLYRYQNDPITAQQVAGYIQAAAGAAAPGDSVVESGWFRYLQPGLDYFVHSSGLWIALKSPLRREEMLAVTFITQAGDTVGSYNPERLHNAGRRPQLRLLKASGPNHQPGRPTWDFEMHQVYRVSGSNEVELQSVGLTISLGELSAGRTFKRAPDGSDLTWLRLLGLDNEAPQDQLDRSRIYQPARDALQDQPPVSGTFIVLPTLRPFLEPPPLPSLGLSAAQTRIVLGADANRRIYETVDPFERENAGLFRLTMPYRVKSEGVVSMFALGAIGLRDGSERIWAGNRLLERGQDYTIDYDIGQVTLADPQSLFAADPSAEIRATWEQKPVFQIAPTSVFGLNARYRLGERGELNFMGLYQAEKTLMRRPQLGVEPASIVLSGMSGSLDLETPWLDHALESVPGLRVGAPSIVRLDGEVAVSLPNPNTRGSAFLDDFEAANEIPIPTHRLGWKLGSAPAFIDGAEGLLPAALNQSDAASLVWQHDWVVLRPGGDSAGIFPGLAPREIDRQIAFAGTETREPVLLLSFGTDPATVFDRRRWRSITTVLATTGRDLTRSEYVELYAAGGTGLTLVLDLGTVSEDAYFIDESGQVSGSRPDTRDPWGQGTLDEEANPLKGEIWSDQLDRRGVWPEGCTAARGRVYPPADPRANCTRGNGIFDTEDLDGNGNLDLAERTIRYVVRLDGTSPYLVRDTTETGSGFRLYRIPLRDPGAVNVGHLFTDADWRGVKHLRVTVTGRQPAGLLLARIRIVGSRWVKRSRDGVARGIGGDTVGLPADLEVGPVSQITDGAVYASPPGVRDELQDPTVAFSVGGAEFNEKALRLRYRGLAPGQRVEVYNRFPQNPWNILTYRRLRVWAVARSGDWGRDRPTWFLLKVATDSENFYLYRVRLVPAANPQAVSENDWLPEHVIDFEAWLRLRREAEEVLLRDPPDPTDPPVMLWSQDSTYAIALKDRARAPNLAAVRELALAVLNAGEAPVRGEIWVNELRLADAVEDAGFAGHVNVDLQAAEFLTGNLSFTGRGALFRQLEGNPAYQRDQGLNLSSTAQLDRLLPAAWGIDLPLSLSHSSSGQLPTFLNQSDVRADRLEGLRETQGRRTRVGLSFRKRTPSVNPWVGWLADGLDLRFGYSTSSTSSIASTSDARGVDASVGYARQLEPRTVPVVPGFLAAVLRAVLPGFLERSLLGARLRWNPESVSFGTSYFQQEARSFRYEQILKLPGDSAVAPTLSPREGLSSNARVSFRPFESLTTGFELTSDRDLLSPEQTVKDSTVHPLLAAERRRLAGLDLGWETGRNLRTQLGYRPELASWLLTSVDVSTSYTMDRNAAYVDRGREATGAATKLQRNMGGQRDVRASLTLDPARVVESVWGAPAPGDRFLESALRKVASALRPLDVAWTRGVNSHFNRSAADPALGFQLGLGGIDHFRFVENDTAATAAERESWNARTSVELPMNLSVALDYSRTTVSTFDARSQRQSRGRGWPNLAVRLGELPIPVGLRRYVTRASLSSGYQRSEQLASFGQGALQERRTVDTQIPVDVSLTLLGTLSTTYRGQFQTGKSTDPTGDTDRTQTSHNVSFLSSFRPPGSLGRTFARPIQVSIRYSHANQQNCRVSTASEQCVPFIDQVIRGLQLTLDSTLSDMNVGVQMSLTDRQSFVGQRTGNSQFQLGIFGQFLFTAGRIR